MVGSQQKTKLIYRFRELFWRFLGSPRKGDGIEELLDRFIKREEKNK
jgi:hypothetical protein